MPPSAKSSIRSRLCAFGLSIVSEVPLLGADGTASPKLPAVFLRRARAAAAATGEGGEMVIERHWPDGSLGMRVRRLAGDAYAIDAPGHGGFRVSPAGDVIDLHDLRGPPERWHRPLLGQALPLAATLRGYETLHASAAVLDGCAVAVTAPSNTGKSSLMFQLVDRGAGLLTDDVLALTLRDGHLHAHPGSPLANLATEQHGRLSPATQTALGRPVGADDKQTFVVTGLRVPVAPLRALVSLRRSGRLRQLTMTRVIAPTPAQLLAATFLPHITTPARMRLQLDVCAVLARSVLVFELDAPASAPASELARVVEDAVRAPVGGAVDAPDRNMQRESG